MLTSEPRTSCPACLSIRAKAPMPVPAIPMKWIFKSLKDVAAPRGGQPEPLRHTRPTHHGSPDAITAIHLVRISRLESGNITKLRTEFASGGIVNC